MEVTSTLSKTIKRFTIPRSTSSMGSFTTSNGTATNLESKLDESYASSQAIEMPPSNGHSSSYHKHPPLSYVQHIRPVQHLSQQNLSSISSSQTQDHQQKFHLPARPLSGDISSFMVRSSSIDFHPSNEIKVINHLLIRVIEHSFYLRSMCPVARNHRFTNLLFNETWVTTI